MKAKITIITGALAAAAWATNLNTGGLSGVNNTYSGYSIGTGSYEVGLSGRFDYGHEALDLRPTPATMELKDVFLLSQDLFMAFGVTNWMDIAADFPIYQALIEGLRKNEYGIGDLALSLKLMHPGMRSDAIIRLAYIMRATFPTGTFDKGYYPRSPEFGHVSQLNEGGAFTSGGYNLNPMLAWTFDLQRLKSPKPWLVHVNFGMDALFYPSDKDNIPEENTAMVGGLALEWLTSQTSSLFLDFYGKSRMINITSGPFLKIFAHDQLYLALGFRNTFASGLTASFSVDGALSTQRNHTQWSVDHGPLSPTRYGTQPTPIIGATLTLSFGQVGRKADSDHDGNPNQSDKCPQDAEDYDGYEDGNGCPDPVHMTSEPVVHWDTVVVTKRDTVQIVRNDTVRVMVADTAQYRTGQDPNTIFPFGKTIFPAINFQTNSDVLAPTSFKTLNDIAQSMNNFPMVSLQITGYTDNTGSDATNSALSQKRAESVVKYLVDKGVDASRLQAIGKGAAEPVSSNRTADGRLLNRRVEFRRWK